jgi:hypothetical protein
MKKESKQKTPKFKQDWRKTNSALHLLYTKWAVGNLVVIDRALKKLVDTHNISMFGAIFALKKERAKLVAEDAAYADADEILRIAKAGDKSLAT